MGERPKRLESLSVPTFQLSSVQAAAVAELLRIAPVADRLGELFSNAGHELYLVGGSVRDALLGRLGHDLDFATSARPDAVEKLLRKFSPAVWTIGKEFGTIGCKVDAGGTPAGSSRSRLTGQTSTPGIAGSRRSPSATLWTVIYIAAISPSTQWR